jgi:glycosyltransferase involved in cell wall biosynthesis
LHEKYDVSVFGYSEINDQRLTIGETLPYPIYTGKRYDDSGLVKAIERINPDVVLLSHDAFLYGCLPEIRVKFPKVKIVGWFTIDGHPIPSGYRNILLACDALVSPTEYGKNVIQKQFVDIPVFTVPYAVDGDLFGVESDRKKLISNLKDGRFRFNDNFEEKMKRDDVFVGIFWGHNQSKKNLSSIFESWVSANLPVEKSHLLMVTHSVQANRGALRYLGDYDYGDYVMQYSDRIQVVEGTFLDKYMASLVKLANILIFPSIGEGFGMPLLEAMSCGIVPITTDYAGATDFCRHGFNSLLIGGELLTGELGVKRLAASTRSLTDSIKWLYRSFNEKDAIYMLPDLVSPDDMSRSKPVSASCWSFMSSNAKVTAKKFTWNRTVMELDKIIQSVVDERFKRSLVHTEI